MNKWKIAFWSCFVSLLGLIIIGIYNFNDQSTSLMYMEEGYQSTETDLLDIVELINKTDLSKKQILNVLKEHQIHEHGEFEKDTILLSRMQLIFKGEKLYKIRDLWK